MGWTGIFNAIRKSNGTIDRKATLERDFSGWSNGESITKMLKGSMAGSVFYAAMETTTPAGREVWALVVLTSTNGAEFCYKEMDETCGPCEASCPVSILDALTPTTNETANAWRQRCRENLEKKKAAAGRIPRNATQLYITFLRDTTASRAGESVMVYKIDGAWIYTSKTGGRWRLTAALLRNDDFIRINGTEEPTPEPLQEEVTANAQEATTTAGTNADTETPTQGETAPQDATSKATTATDNTSSTATQNATTTAGNIHSEQDNTGSDTRPPRAAEKVTTGNAAGHTSTPANQEPGTAAGAITGRTTTPPQNPGHACENAPGREERHGAEQVPIAHTKSPPRAAQKAGNRSPQQGTTAAKTGFWPECQVPKNLLGKF